MEASSFGAVVGRLKIGKEVFCVSNNWSIVDLLGLKPGFSLSRHLAQHMESAFIRIGQSALGYKLSGLLSSDHILQGNRYMHLVSFSLVFLNSRLFVFPTL